MPATVQIIEKNGVGGTPTDKTGGNVRMKKADNSTVDLVNPLVKPTSGSDWSFEKWLRLNITGGSFTQMTNAKMYTDGSSGLGTGINLWAKAVASYTTPALGSASTGYTNAFTYSSGAPLSLGAGPFTGTGEKGDHAVLLAEVTSAAAGGLTPSEALTFGWDEI
ncbi:hypothetical protein [Hydrogenophaga sp. 2FB]|uniref:hypothetical protein n=1 Tax=Hydrogenophaga sp. 2FB TaxID=2502187 RepID=UPI0010F9FC2E|nr:hypothetical protein [Hydrogenophaga sp. 2FB]